jgi:DNA anti-recombination protein RmuC
MASLTAEEFAQTVRYLADDLGAQRLRDKLVRLNALVTRRGIASAEALANQLYTLTGGLRRQVAATLALQSLWAERMTEQLGEEGEKALEGLAEKINACLDQGDTINAEKESELDELLQEYEQRLAEKVGPERARIDMLLKAVPAIAAKLRTRPIGTTISDSH